MRSTTASNSYSKIRDPCATCQPPWTDSPLERKPLQGTCRSSICPQPSICQRSSAVYEATCQLCGRSYIGMTSRRLHDRMEHMASVRKKDEKTAFGVHYEAEHPRSASPPCFITVTRRTPSPRRRSYGNKITQAGAESQAGRAWDRLSSVASHSHHLSRANLLALPPCGLVNRFSHV